MDTPDWLLLPTVHSSLGLSLLLADLLLPLLLLIILPSRSLRELEPVNERLPLSAIACCASRLLEASYLDKVLERLEVLIRQKQLLSCIQELLHGP
jgi:hypothetical protein